MQRTRRALRPSLVLVAVLMALVSGCASGSPAPEPHAGTVPWNTDVPSGHSALHRLGKTISAGDFRVRVNLIDCTPTSTPKAFRVLSSDAFSVTSASSKSGQRAQRCIVSGRVTNARNAPVEWTSIGAARVGAVFYPPQSRNLPTNKSDLPGGASRDFNVTYILPAGHSPVILWPNYQAGEDSARRLVFASGGS